MTDDSFLARWSRLKRRHGSAAPVVAEAEPAPVAPPPPAPGGGPVVDAARPPAAPDAPPDAAPDAAQPAQDDPGADLPPVESLTGESDFTPFLRPGVPDDLHRQALRRLWTSDPVYANLDGLKDYDDDYTGLFTGDGVVKTLYRVGRGFLDAETPAGQDDAQVAQEHTKDSDPIEADAVPPPAAMRDGA